MDNILIIGGTGKVGSALVQQLAQKKIKARVLLRNNNKVNQIENLGMTTAMGDVTNIASIAAAMKGIEKLFLLVSPNPDEAKIKSAIIEEAKKAGIKHIVMLSGAGANNNSAISQAQQHAKAEDYLKASGLDFTILQPYFFMQNFINQAVAIKSQGAIYGNYGEGKLAIVDARDIAAVATACLTENGHNNQTYIITGGEAITNADAAKIVSDIIGKNVNYVDMPSEQLKGSLTNMGYPEWLANDLVMLGENISAGEFSKTTDTVERIAHKNPISFSEFIRDNANVFL